MINIALVFPPQWCPSGPYLSIPSLSAYLSDLGFNVFQKDVNIEYYSIILGPEFLKKRVEILRQRYEKLNAFENLSRKDQLEYQSLFDVLADQDFVIQEIDTAVKNLRSNDFYDIASLKKNTWFIERALNLVSASFYPTKISLTDYHSPYSEFRITDIVDAISDIKTNPILPYLPELLHNWISQTSPSLLGISIIGVSQILPGLTIGAWIKEHFPGIHVVIGGSIFTRWANESEKFIPLFNKCFDTIIVHEGEKPLADLALALEHNTDIKSINNLIYKDPLLGTVRNPVSTPIEIDLLPTPSFDGLPLEKYLSPELVLPILSSRGCYWNKCSFCDHSFIYGNHYSFRQPENVIEDIVLLSNKYHTKYFAFSDEAIAPKELTKIANGIIQKNLDISYVTALRFEAAFCSDELCKLLYASGLQLVNLGFESGSPKILQDMKKGTTLEVIKKNLICLSRAGIWNHLFVILGFPTETDIDYELTENFIKDNKGIIHSVGASTFGLCKYSYICQHPDKYEICIENDTNIDLPLFYDFVKPNLNKDNKEFQLRFEKMIMGTFPDNVIWRSLERIHLLLYLHKFSPSIIKNFELKGIMESTSKLDLFRYTLNQYVCIRKTKFDFTQANKSGDYPSGDYILIYNTQNGVIFSVTEIIVDVINAFIKGWRVEKIASMLRNQFSIDNSEAQLLLNEVMESFIRDQILIKVPE